MELVEESTHNHTVSENSTRLRAMSDEVKSLSDMLSEYRRSCDMESSVESQVARITEVLENEPEHSDSYDDELVRQIIDTIKVIDEGRLEIYFKGGFRYEQPITLKVRKLRAS